MKGAPRLPALPYLEYLTTPLTVNLDQLSWPLDSLLCAPDDH